MQLSLVNAQFIEERRRTVALSQSELLRLLESLRSAEELELVRSVAERMLQELIEAEAAAKIGLSGTSTPTPAPTTATDTGTRR